MKLKPQDLWVLARDSASAWSNDNVGRLGAALAFFTTFSLGPMLIIVIVLSSVGFGPDAARGHLFAQIHGLIGVEGAAFVQELIENAYLSDSSLLAAAFGTVTLLFGASAVFVQLRDSLNTVFHVREKPMGSIIAFVRARLLSFAMIVGIGFLLLVSLVVSTFLTAMSDYLSRLFSDAEIIVRALDVIVSFIGVTAMFSLIFMYLPDVIISWRDILVGGAVTSLLFTLGKFLIGLYLGNSEIGSTFGAASSLVVIMLWSFYSSQIVLFGAEFTRIFAIRFGAGVLPGKNAYRMDIRTIKTRPSRRRAIARSG